MRSTKKHLSLYTFRIKSYFKHKLKAKGIIFMHSPFVYDLQRNVLYNVSKKKALVDALRRELRNNNALITHNDHGVNKGIKTCRLKDIAAKSAQQPRYSRLIAQLAKHYGCENIVELGTSLGFTTATIALENPQASIITIDASTEVLKIAVDNFRRLSANNIAAINADFDSAIKQPKICPAIHQPVDMVIFDGNHEKEATLRYFNHFLNHHHDNSIFIFDDIHWSKGMNEAWQQIKSNEQVSLTLDLHKIGIVFFKKEIKQKRDFMIRM